MWDDIREAIEMVQGGKIRKAVLPEHGVTVYKCNNIIRIDIKIQEVKANA